MTIDLRRLFIVAALALTAAACSNNLGVRTPQPPPPNYGALATAFLTAIPAKPQLAGAFISAIQATKPPQPGDWAVCVRLASGAAYAVFYTDGAVTDGRNALPVDRCEVAEGYAPLPSVAPPKPAAPSKPAKNNSKLKAGRFSAGKIALTRRNIARSAS